MVKRREAKSGCDGGTDPDDDGGGKLRWLVAARHGHLKRRPMGKLSK
jgi:hypothetical protein